MSKHDRTLQCAGLLLCVLVACPPAVAAAAEPSASPFIVDSWSNEEGLPDSEVISVIQTRDGYLWLGTLHGLVRFDGMKFTIFDEENTPGLDSDRIVCLFEDSETNLWLGTESSGLEMIRNGRIKNFGAEGAGNSGKVLYAYEDSSSNVWFDTSGGIVRYHNGKMDFYPGVMWPQLLSLAQRLIVPSASGGYWRILNGSVEKWQDNRLAGNLGLAPWKDLPVTSACEDKAGNLIVGTLGAGVFWLDANGRFQQVSEAQGLSSRFVLSLCLDGDGNLWAGTDGGGLNRIKRTVFHAPDERHPWSAQSLAEDGSGALWAAFNARGVTCWATNAARDFGVGRGSNAWAVLVDSHQRVWAGTRNEGLFQLEGDQFQPAPDAGIPGPQIFALFEDRAGQLWAGTQNGLARWNGENWKVLTTRDGLSGNAVRALANDAAGNLWIGTESRGLNLFADGKFTAYRAAQNGLPGDDISCLCADRDNVLWVGTSGHGLARFQNGNWKRYSTANGLAGNSIGYIIEDDVGNLWVGSSQGLMRIQRKSLADPVAGATRSIFWRVYGKNDGLPTRECSSGSQPAALRARDGRLFFPTTKGVVSVNPSELKPNPKPPVVTIESIFVDGREQKTNRLDSAWPPAIMIPPGREQLEIHYTALNFSAPKEVRFKYRLEGHESAWTDAGGERFVRYPKLPPGDYRFQVIAGNEDGVWNETGAALQITVQPQYWQTGWFRVAAIACLLGLIIGAVRYFSTQKLHRQLQALKHREALEKERARIARDLHDQLGANLTQVALLGEMAEADKNAPEEMASHARQISQTARETTRSLDEIVWAVNPANDTLDGLVSYACKFAQEYLLLAGVRCRADVAARLPATILPPEVRHNAFLAFKEAVNNVVRHAQATETWIRLRVQPDHFILEIEDNGRGLPALGDKWQGTSDMNPTPPVVSPATGHVSPWGNGLRNMRKRMEDIHGEFFIGPGANGGTIVRLKIPIEKH